MRGRRFTQSSQISRRCEVTCRSTLVGLLLALLGAIAPLHAQIVRGQVVDSITRAPVVGAILTLLNAGRVEVDRTVANEMGHFQLRASAAGRYRLRVERDAYRTTTFPPFTIDRVHVIPALEAVLSPLCADQPHRPGQRIVVGVVRDDQNRTVRETARVVALSGPVELSALTDAAGFYVICGIPPYVPVYIWAEYVGKEAITVTLTFDDAGVDRQVRLRSGAGSQSEYRQTTRTTWVEDFQLVQLPVLPRTTRSSIGFKFGGTYATITGTGITADARGGFQLGVFYEAQFKEQVAVQIEGVYVQQGAFSPIDGRTMRLNYVRLPILAKFRLSGDTTRSLMPYVFGGPAVGFDTRFHKGVPKGDLSFMLGGGVSVKAGEFSILLDGSFGFGLTAPLPPLLRESGKCFCEKLEPEEFFFEGKHFKNRALSFSIGLSIPMGGNVAGLGGRDDASRRSPLRFDLITREELTATGLATAYEIVQCLHPRWLRARGQVRLVEGTEPIVYVNSSRRSNLEELRSIMAESIAEIIYFNGRDATFRFGSGHGSGVIQVITGR